MGARGQFIFLNKLQVFFIKSNPVRFHKSDTLYNDSVNICYFLNKTKAPDFSKGFMFIRNDLNDYGVTGLINANWFNKEKCGAISERM